ncbi:MAG: TRAP transporter small permease [Burkholderiales bacterium]|jgi:TRAP-type C4-dicarboxylate transport system permease small subunit|nr:TRAP transporter small permease [Burkholderiales bacterium]
MSSPTDEQHGDATAPDPRNTPRVTIRIEEAIAAAAMALICVITFANVVVRYLTNASFAFTEEISVFLLVVLTLVGAAAAFARDRNIRVDFFVLKLPAAARFALELAGMALSAALFAMVAWYGWRFFLDDWQYETTSPGLGIPQAVYSIWLTVLAVLIVARIAGRLVRVARRR